MNKFFEIFTKMGLRKQLLCTAILIACLQVLGEFISDVNLKLLKPIPIVCLIMIIKLGHQRWIFCGLMFCLLGDILLMSKQMQMFIVGTISFLLGHLCYIKQFINRSNRINDKRIRLYQLIGTLCILLILVLQIYQFWDKTPYNLVFVCYGMMLSLMVISSIYTYQYEQKLGQKYWMTLSGALLFVFSDSLIALLKFNGIQNSFGDGIIMSTYYLAQFLIGLSSILRTNCKQISKEKQKIMSALVQSF